MLKFTLRRSGMLALLVIASLSASPAAGATAAVMDHQVRVTLDVEAHTLRVIDSITVPAGVTQLRLNADLVFDEIRVQDNARVDPAVVTRLVEEDGDRYQVLELERMGMSRGGRMLLRYGGEFFAAVENVTFSRENVGGEIEATIGDEGIYLSAGARWLATADSVMATHDLTVDAPAGFESVTQGYRALHEEHDGRLITQWVAARPSDGLTLVANRYVVHAEPVREGLTSYTYFLEDDARLRATYMERTKAYIAMYEEMIGPYPYGKFATVENWFPTGYGMPSYTLLGGQVLRLPFIPYTSFGHEIAHNWWGNSVFVDLAEGNWCEGLTVYCADYHYKELDSPAAAREYRRNLLKNYAAYIKDPEKDFPLSEFRSRHSGATRAVGYGKSMMVFHMIERLVGRESFLAGLRQVAAAHQYEPAAWSDFLAAFGERGQRDLAPFATQWLTRTGAPELALAATEFAADGIRFTLRQGEPAYDLEVPVTVTAADGVSEHIVRLENREQDFELKIAGATRLAVDPDCHLFRRLDAAEIEPTLSQVLGDEDPVFVGTESEATLAFARAFAERDDISLQSAPPATTGGHASVVLNPEPALLGQYRTPALEIAGKTAFLEGKRYDLNQHDLVFAAANPRDPAVSDLVVLCAAPERLASLARRVGHYGKYSWLALPAGQGAVVRGNWAPGASPLIAER